VRTINKISIVDLGKQAYLEGLKEARHDIIFMRQLDKQAESSNSAAHGQRMISQWFKGWRMEQQFDAQQKACVKSEDSKNFKIEYEIKMWNKLNKKL